MSSAQRSIVVPRLLALLGLLGMLVLIGFQFQALTWESGDRVLYLSYAGVGTGAVTTLAAAVWTAWTRRKGGAIAALVISVLLNPIWLLLLIRAFG